MPMKTLIASRLLLCTVCFVQMLTLSAQKPPLYTHYDLRKDLRRGHAPDLVTISGIPEPAPGSPSGYLLRDITGEIAFCSTKQANIYGEPCFVTGRPQLRGKELVLVVYYVSTKAPLAEQLTKRNHKSGRR
jgi:hypothetical protein